MLALRFAESSAITFGRAPATWYDRVRGIPQVDQYSESFPKILQNELPRLSNGQTWSKDVEYLLRRVATYFVVAVEMSIAQYKWIESTVQIVGN